MRLSRQPPEIENEGEPIRGPRKQMLDETDMDFDHSDYEVDDGIACFECTDVRAG